MALCARLAPPGDRAGWPGLRVHNLSCCTKMGYAAAREGRFMGGYSSRLPVSALHCMSAKLGGINAMAFIPIPNGVQVEMIYTWQNQRVQNVYCVTKGSPANNADLSQVFTLFENWERNVARNRRHGLVACTQCDVTALDFVGAPVKSGIFFPTINGVLGTSPLPAFVSLVVRHTTGLSGRSHRGRTYHIGLTQGQAPLGDQISQGDADATATIYNTLRTTLLGSGWTFVVASRYSGVEIVNGRRRAIPRAQGIMTPVVQSVAERYLDTNRHRKLPFQT